MNSKSKDETESSEAQLHNADALIRLASAANILAWVFLVFTVSRAIYELIVPADFHFETALFYDLRSIILFPSLFGVDPLTNFAQGAIAFVILRAISEGIYLLLDIDADTREILDELKKRRE